MLTFYITICKQTKNIKDILLMSAFLVLSFWCSILTWTIDYVKYPILSYSTLYDYSEQMPRILVLFFFLTVPCSKVLDVMTSTVWWWIESSLIHSMGVVGEEGWIQTPFQPVRVVRYSGRNLLFKRGLLLMIMTFAFKPFYLDLTLIFGEISNQSYF